MTIKVLFSEYDGPLIAKIEDLLEGIGYEAVTTGYDTKTQTYELNLEPVEEEDEK